MRVLVTGAGGYVGSHLVGALRADGHAVTPWAREVRPEEALAGQDALVHAALVWGAPGTEHELHDVALSERMFEAAGRAGVRRCLYLSSTAVHRPFAPVMREDDALAPSDVYGVTKAAGEDRLRAACAAHGMTGVVLRPGPIVGPPAVPGGPLRTPHILAVLVETARRGEPLRVDPGDGRQLVDVTAVARAVALLATGASSDGTDSGPVQTYLCTDRAVLGFAELAQEVVEALGSASPVDLQPAAAAAAPPRFVTDRIESLLGAPLDARPALRAHLRLLAASP